MQCIKMIKPGRWTFLSLGVLFTLAPVGTGVYHLLNDESRTAASIADLGARYQGSIWSSTNPETQNVPAILKITSRNRTRFTGNLVLGSEAGTPVGVTGGVSATGRVALNGSFHTPFQRFRINATGQLSAGGNAIIGSYTASAQQGLLRINDRGSLALLVTAQPE